MTPQHSAAQRSTAQHCMGCNTAAGGTAQSVVALLMLLPSGPATESLGSGSPYCLHSAFQQLGSRGDCHCPFPTQPPPSISHLRPHILSHSRMDAVALEAAPFVLVTPLQLTELSHSSDSISAISTSVSTAALSANVSSPAASSPSSPSSQPCPQPSPLNGVTASSPVLPSPFSLDEAVLLPPPSLADAVTGRPAALPSLTVLRLFYGSSSPFAPIPHHRRSARWLFGLLSHPLTLLCASLVMLTAHLLLLYASTYGLYLLYASSALLSRLSTAAFTVFLCFLLVRSCLSVSLVSLRVLQPRLWVNVPPRTGSRLLCGYYPTLLLLRVLSLLFLLLATAVLIFATPLTLSTPSLLLLFALLSYDAISLSLPLLIVPALAFLLPLHSLHMAFPFIPITPPLPPQLQPGMSASQLAQLDETVWDKRPADEEADVCAVCLSELSEGERVRRLPKCCHVFHVACIDSWLERRARCPLCVQTVVATLV